MKSVAVLLTLAMLGLGCARTSPVAKAPEPAPAAAKVVLKLERGPAARLPDPMLVADGVHGGAFETCYRPFRPTGDPKSDLVQMAALCGGATSMRPVTEILEGSQAQNDPIARYTFMGELGRCYRIFSASDRGIRDLDMALLDPSHAVVGHDTNEDAFPILDPDGPVCLTRPGPYTVLVSVERGGGHYALQVWGF
jgi:hypothetical protein